VVGLEALAALEGALGGLEGAPGASEGLEGLEVERGALEGLGALEGALGVLGALPSLCCSSIQDTALDNPDTHGHRSEATASPSGVRRIVGERGHDVKPFCTVA
jgi:hypothetical protein